MPGFKNYYDDPLWYLMSNKSSPTREDIEKFMSLEINLRIESYNSILEMESKLRKKLEFDKRIFPAWEQYFQENLNSDRTNNADKESIKNNFEGFKRNISEDEASLKRFEIFIDMLHEGMLLSVQTGPEFNPDDGFEVAEKNWQLSTYNKHRAPNSITDERKSHSPKGGM